MKPRISIIVRCFNEEKHIGKLLNGILEQSIKDIEIIVVDSGSTDATVSIASHYPVKIITINPEDFSFGYSLNQGCLAAKGEFLVFASAHVYPVYVDWLEKLLAPFENPAIGLTYGKQRGNEITKFSEHQIFAKWFPENSNLSQSHPFCNNANAAIRRGLWEKMRYDETLTGLEDLEWAKRLLATGYLISYVAEAEIIHVHEETAKNIYNRYQREAITFKKIFPEQHVNFWDFIRLYFSNVFGDFYYARRERLLLANILSIPVFRFLQFWGCFRGFNRKDPVTRQMKQAFYYPRNLKPVPKCSNNTSKPIDYSAIHHSHE